MTCEHQRADWRSCPWCTGLNDAARTLAPAEYTITVTLGESPTVSFGQGALVYDEVVLARQRTKDFISERNDWRRNRSRK